MEEHKQAQDETCQRDERLKELQSEIAPLKRKYEHAEEERMKYKSEVSSKVQGMEERATEMRLKIEQTVKKSDVLSLENKSLLHELNEERNKYISENDTITQLEMRLKFAYTVTDRQLSEVEDMLAAEQKRNKVQQGQISKLYGSLREKEEKDVKPEHILIDRFGLADLGNAAAVDRDGHVLSISPVGTPYYIAPELLQAISAYKFKKSMHDVRLGDFRSMGIISFELICEIPPFHEDYLHETYSKILRHCEDSNLQEPFSFPSDLKISLNFTNLIKFLNTPTNRLIYEKIRKYSFFERSKILQDAKTEINKMKNIIRNKIVELQQYKMQMKTLQSAIKVEEELWGKKEAIITEMLRMNRKKYEEARIASEHRYEKLIAEKNNELVLTMKKMDACENELTSKNGECIQLRDKMEVQAQAFREQMIVERQAARTANLALWKTEKKLEEIEGEKKLLQRRMELTGERIKRVQAERDEAQRLHKQAQDETRQGEERLNELKSEIASLKRDISTERRKYERAEEERMKSKSEIIEHIANVQRMEERAIEMRLKIEQTQKKDDSLSLENKRLLHELNDERNKYASANDTITELEMRLRNFKDNYDRLKFACIVTDRQLTEIEAMLEAERKRHKVQKEKISKLYGNLRGKEKKIAKLKRELHDERAQKKSAVESVRIMIHELQKQNNAEIQRKLNAFHKELFEQTNKLFAQEEHSEINLFFEEDVRIVRDLFHSKKGSHSSATTSYSKDNLISSTIKSSILYRTLEEELRREVLRSKTLQCKLDKFNTRDNFN